MRVGDGRPPRRAGPPGDEPIPAPGHCLDETRLLGVVAQGTTNLEDDDPEHAVGHVRVPPDGSQQVVLPDELPRVLGQATENRECLRRERHHVAFMQELLVGEVERVAFEAQEPIGVHRPPGEPPSHCVLTAI